MGVESGGRTVPGHVDSVGKIVEHLSLLATEEVRWGPGEGKVLRSPPYEVRVTPSLLRAMTCVAGCTACCLPFTLDYTPDEFEHFYDNAWTEEIRDQARDAFELREVWVNGREVSVFSYAQYLDPACPYLRPTREGGALGCGFWTKMGDTQPLTCAAAPNLLITSRGEGRSMVMKRPFGRGWAWNPKPQCEFDEVPVKAGWVDWARVEPAIEKTIMLLGRYEDWADWLGIQTVIPEVIGAVERMRRACVEEGMIMPQVVHVD